MTKVDSPGCRNPEPKHWPAAPHLACPNDPVSEPAVSRTVLEGPHRKVVLRSISPGSEPAGYRLAAPPEKPGDSVGRRWSPAGDSG
jgi:hypothetical protein